jgi:glycosyltransferase involved in cell wall biosynthesis
MRLLICAMEYPPHSDGIGNFVSNIVTHLKNQGLDCKICSPSGPDIKLGSQTLIEKYGFFGLLFFWYAVTRHLKSTTYDMIWVHNPYFIFSTPLSRGVVTIHTTYYGVWFNHVGYFYTLHIYNKIASIIEHYCLHNIDKTTIITCVGKQVFHELKEIGIDIRRINCIPYNGVDSNRFKPQGNKKELRKKLGIPENDIVLLSVGRLTPNKRPHVLIDIISILEKKRGDITLCFAGKGELLDDMRELVKKRGLKKVIFLGYVDDENLPLLYSCSDYYIMASHYEGAPLTLYEALASGLSCIVSDIPSLDLVKQSDCGIAVNFENIEESSKTILAFLSDSHSEQAKNARDLAIRELDWSIITQKYMEIFKRQSV